MAKKNGQAAEMERAAPAEAPEPPAMESADWEAVDNDCPIYGLEDGQSTAGYFLRTEIRHAKGKDRTVHFLARYDDRGAEFGVWGAAILDRKMKSLRPGQFVKLTRNGEIPGSDAIMYTVERAKGVNMIVQQEAAADVADEDVAF